MPKLLDASYYERRRRDWLADEKTHAEYDRARREIEREMFGVPESPVELNQSTAPPQQLDTLQRAQGRLP